MKRLQNDLSEQQPVDLARIVERRSAIVSRLEEINGPSIPTGSSLPIEKKDVHWDHVMQEMVNHDIVYQHNSTHAIHGSSSALIL